MRACVSTCLAYHRGLRACGSSWFTCQHARSVLTFHFYVPTCHNPCTMFQVGVPRCQTAYQFWTWRVNLPEGVFKTFLFTLLLYKKFYYIRDITVMHIICICIVHKNCIILHFYTSFHIKEKCGIFLFYYFFSL